jgi:hypothetical protein
MVDHLEQMPVDLTEAFGQAVSTLIAWKDGEEPTVNVHGRPTPITAIASLVETYKGTMPAKLYWSLVRHANCSPERRTEALKLTEDSSYEAGVRRLLEWIRNNESKFWRNDSFGDDLEVDLERAVRAASVEGPDGHILSVAMLAAPPDDADCDSVIVLTVLSPTGRPAAGAGMRHRPAP